MKFKFEVGEIAITKSMMMCTTCDEVLLSGLEVEVLAINRTGCSILGSRHDYVIEMPDGCHGYVTEESLRKRRPPEQPADDEFQNDLGKWLHREKAKEEEIK